MKPFVANVATNSINIVTADGASSVATRNMFFVGFDEGSITFLVAHIMQNKDLKTTLPKVLV